MITFMALIIYSCWLNETERIKFTEELNRSKYMTAFIGLFFIAESIIEVILGLIKLIFKKK